MLEASPLRARPRGRRRRSPAPRRWPLPLPLLGCLLGRAMQQQQPPCGQAAALTPAPASAAAARPAPEPGLRYRCLLLDHDDTTVKSTAEIHYPAHVDSVRQLRPDLEPVSLHGWFEKNHEPGVSVYLNSIFPEPGQMEAEHVIWRKWIDGTVPHFYEGMPELLMEFRARGGLVAVISHSPADVIRRHYAEHPLADGIRPDVVFGWDDDRARRKPSPWPAHQALEQLGVEAGEALVLDDLRPGVEMARAAGVAVAAAGWGHSVPIVQDYMRRECDYFLPDVASLAELLMGGTPRIATPASL